MGPHGCEHPNPIIGSLILGVTLAFTDFEAHSAGRALMPPAETELAPFWEKYAASKPLERAFRLSTRPHIYAAPQHVVMAEGCRTSPIGRFWRWGTGAMHDPGCELRRIYLPRTRVNRVGWSQGVEGKEEMPTMEVIST